MVTRSTNTKAAKQSTKRSKSSAKSTRAKRTSAGTAAKTTAKTTARAKTTAKASPKSAAKPVANSGKATAASKRSGGAARSQTSKNNTSRKNSSSIDAKKTITEHGSNGTAADKNTPKKSPGKKKTSTTRAPAVRKKATRKAATASTVTKKATAQRKSTQKSTAGKSSASKTKAQKNTAPDTVEQDSTASQELDVTVACAIKATTDVTSVPAVVESSTQESQEVLDDSIPRTPNDQQATVAMPAAIPAEEDVAALENTDAERPDGSFVVLLNDDSTDMPDHQNADEKVDENVADEKADKEADEKADEDSSFLILFDDDEPEDLTTIENTEGNYKISLAGDIGINNIPKLKSNLESTFDAIGVEINTSGIDGMDTSSVQMLLSYTNNLKNANVPIKWTGASALFNSVTSTLGLTLTD